MKTSATTAKAALLFVLATPWCSLSLPQEAMGGEVSGPATIDCGKKLGGFRHRRLCEKPLEATQRDIQVGGTFLKRFGLRFDMKNAATVTDKTVAMTIWLADLCNDWNACTISREEYQRRKDMITPLLDRFYAVVDLAQALKNEPATRGAESSPAVKGLEATIDHLIVDINQLEQEFGRR